jgi:hypothetical protein
VPSPMKRWRFLSRVLAPAYFGRYRKGAPLRALTEAGSAARAASSGCLVFGRLQSARQPALHVRRPQRVKAITIDALEFATTRFGGHVMHRLAALRTRRRWRILGHSTHRHLEVLPDCLSPRQARNGDEAIMRAVPYRVQSKIGKAAPEIRPPGINWAAGLQDN